MVSQVLWTRLNFEFENSVSNSVSQSKPKLDLKLNFFQVGTKNQISICVPIFTLTVCAFCFECLLPWLSIHGQSHIVQKSNSLLQTT